MQDLPLFQDPVATPEFEQLVRELDELLDRGFLQELEPALEDLFLAKMGVSAEQAA
jgi:hypothetical protein